MAVLTAGLQLSFSDRPTAEGKAAYPILSFDTAHQQLGLLSAGATYNTLPFVVNAKHQLKRIRLLASSEETL